MFFEDMGITYLGPIDGHDIKALYRTFEEAKKLNNAVLVHVITKKGKGYLPAEEFPSKFHGTGPFAIETGEALEKKKKDTYTDVFGKVMCDLAAKDSKVVAITAAMSDGTGLSEFSRRYKKRFFDVGIAEEHAVTFAAGLAAGGLKPVFAVYSSFLQRAYDQLIHDVALQNLPVVFAVDRAGIVGNDGETHQGIFDLSFLSSIPNMTIISPKNRWELADMIRYAIQYEAPIAIRYPRGTAYTGLKEYRKPIAFKTSETIYEEDGIAIFSVGHMIEVAEKVQDYVMEQQLSVEVLKIGVPDEYVEHGNIDVLRKEIMLLKKSLETLSKMCNYPIIITNSNGKMTEIKSAEQLIALGEDKVFTEKLSKEIDNTDITRLEEVGSAGVMMGGDSGLNMYKFNGYWKINQIYQ